MVRLPLRKTLGVFIALAVIGGGALLGQTVFRQHPSTPKVSDADPTVVALTPSGNSADSTQHSSDGDTSTTQGGVPMSEPSPEVHPEQVINDRQFVADGQTYALRSYKALVTPNDPYATQWWVTQSGLTTAWDKGNGSGATIAIIDTGFALNHEELTGRWLTNNGESGATTQQAAGVNCTSRGLALDKSCNGIDDDSNGYIDDYRGWDFIGDNASVQAGEYAPSSVDAFHGTAVTGVAAASANNGKGIAGVSWGAKILPLQALDDDGNGDTVTIARAIRYAADRNVDVINLSLGGPEEDVYLRQAIQYALDRDTIVVAAAGNDGCDCLAYPAIYSEVVSVGAYDSTGNRASFSSYGATLDILAPGSGMLVPAWSAALPTVGYMNGVSGTSFAAPYVSALLANAKAALPAASWGQLVNSLTQTALHGTATASQPRTNQTGFGTTQAGAYLTRLTSSLHVAGRYYLNVPVNDLYGAHSVYDCQGAAFPTVPFYVITTNAVPSYSVSELAATRALARGESVVFKGYVCMGLNADTADFNRIIEPLREFSNYTGKTG